MLDARPEEVFRVSTPSAWPFIAAVGMIVVFGGEIFSLRLLSLGGLVVLIVALTAWNWPTAAPMTREEEEAFEREYEIPVRPQGSRAVARWAMGLTVLILGTALGCFLFSYYYIRIVNETWPPEGIPLPALGLPAVVGILWLLGTIATHWALRRIQRNDQRQLKLGMGVGLGLGLLSTGLQFLYFSRLPFDWSTNAYGSVFFTLGWFALGLMSAASFMSGLVQIWAWRRSYNDRNHIGVQNVALFWWAVLVFWLLISGTLYLFPHLA
jgi:heme/copper-type cytochrome/quinol oxidase subunit 3